MFTIDGWTTKNNAMDVVERRHISQVRRPIDYGASF
jgi:hypothetical protein